MSQTDQEGRGVTPAKVIEGYVSADALADMDSCVFYTNQQFRARLPDYDATLVIGEKAWPESEVRELVKAIQTGIYRGKLGEGPQHTINRIAKEYGLTL